MLQDIHGGRQLGLVALSLLEEIDFEASGPRTIFLVYSFVMHYTSAWQDTLPPLLEAYHGGMAQGDVENAMWAIVLHMNISFYCGKSLAALENDYIIYVKQMKDLRMDQHYTTIEPYLRGARNLLGKSQHASCLPEAEEKIAEYRKMGSAAEGMQRETQLWLKVFFGEDEQGADIALEISKDGVKTSESGLQFLMMTFHMALLCYTAHRRTKRNRYLKLAKKHHQTIKTWAKAGNPNLVFVEQTLSAEAALVDGKKKFAMEKYEAASASVEQLGLRSYRALIAERWGNAKEEIGQSEEAQKHWQEAIKIYEEWGALAVADQLRNKLQTFLTGDDVMEQAPHVSSIVASRASAH